MDEYGSLVELSLAEEMCVLEGKAVPLGLTSVHHTSHMECHGLQTQGFALQNR
jgi:hypothetical protein